MSELLLRELTTTDIDWLKQAGAQAMVPAGHLLIPAGTVPDCFYLLLDGRAAITLPRSALDPLQQAFAVIEGTTGDQEIMALENGDVFGSLPGLVAPLPTATVVAKTDCTVLALPMADLLAQLGADVAFAGRFYKWVAILLAGRLQRMLRRLGRRNLAQGKLLRDVWLVFGEFHDSDVEWLMAMGKVQQVAAGEVLLQAGKAIEHLYLVLDGSLVMFWEEAAVNPLLQAFAVLEGQEIVGREVAQLGQGALVGVSPFLDGRLERVTMRSATGAVVLAIPRRLVLAKLQQDLGFAGRFYRVLGVVMGHRLQGVCGRLGYGRRVYAGGDEDELDMDAIDRMGLAGRRFELMLGKLMSGVLG
jgi:bacteriocin-type transport-associated protein